MSECLVIWNHWKSLKNMPMFLNLRVHRMSREESIAIVGERQDDSQAGVGFPNHCTAWPQIQISYSFPLPIYWVLW